MGDQRRPARRRGRWLLAAVVLIGGAVGGTAVGCAAAGCSPVGGTAVIAPYRSPPLGSLSSTPLRAGVGSVLAVSPDGDRVAALEKDRGVCLRRVTGVGAEVCAALPFTGRHTISAAFSPDGRRLAVGRDVTAQGAGSVYLVDVVTGRAQAVSVVKTAGATTAYVGMVWDQGIGQSGVSHLLLVDNSIGAGGATTRIVDVDPTSLIPRVVVEATGPYEFQSGYVAAGGPAVIFTVYRGDQLAPNLVVVDLDSGERREFGPLGANGTQLVPLGVSPDGRSAIVGSATYQHSGPPRLLDLASGRLTEIPGLDGDFLVAAFSPNGSQVAVVAASDTTSSQISVAPVGGGPARKLAQFPAGPSPVGRLTWSRQDVVAIETPIAPGAAASVAGSIVGWRLSG